jgi:hypothetical protein
VRRADDDGGYVLGADEHDVGRRTHDQVVRGGDGRVFIEGATRAAPPLANSSNRATCFT